MLWMELLVISLAFENDSVLNVHTAVNLKLKNAQRFNPNLSFKLVHHLQIEYSRYKLNQVFHS